jgi:multisubunit Na+/H+ antiporter MnhB subunit
MFSRKLSIISLVLIVAIFLTITGNVVFFSKILNTSFKAQQIYGFCPIGSHHISNHILIKNRAIIIRKITDHGS